MEVEDQELGHPLTGGDFEASLSHITKQNGLAAILFAVPDEATCHKLSVDKQRAGQEKERRGAELRALALRSRSCDLR